MEILLLGDCCEKENFCKFNYNNDNYFYKYDIYREKI